MNRTEQLNVIHEKIQLLLNRLHEQQQRMAGLEEENDSLKKLLNERNSKVAELDNQLHLLKLTKSISASGDETQKAALKKKINELIKEIDQCVGLLNN